MHTHFYSCDWGTSAFRLRLVITDSLEVVASLEEGAGILATFQAWERSGVTDRFRFFRAVLQQALPTLSAAAPYPDDPFPIVVSGMASSSVGMKELPYASLPLKLDASGLIVDRIPADTGFPHDLFLISGVQKPGDVMRGEEVQALGWKRLSGPFPTQCTLVFPGTHSKHLIVDKDEVVDFRTFMTGELFEVISKHTILKNSIHPNAAWNEAGQQAFLEGVHSVKKGNLVNALFSIRARNVQGRLQKDEAGFFLSGLLIGNELKDMAGEFIALCGDEKFQPLYGLASQALELTSSVTAYPPDVVRQFVLAGQKVVLEDR